MRTIRALIAAMLLSCAPYARSTDLTDLWLNFNEAGWGVNVVHQADILFLTFFIYGADRSPYWLSASNTQFQGTDAAGNLIYSGQLAQTSGPWFGGAFNPSTVSANVVGTVTFTATSVTTATLTYTVNGVSVTKQLTRYAFRANPYINGQYYGGVSSDLTNCPVASNNVHQGGVVSLGVTGTTSNTQIVVAGNGTCTLSGPYTQVGRMGSINGPISCSNGSTGTVNVFEIEANDSGLTARYQASYTNGCRETGHFGGVIQ